jgi:4-amino-4-deoxychorismate lyase
MRIDFHQARVNRSLNSFYGSHTRFDLQTCIDVPEPFRTGVVKCRIVYEKNVVDIHYGKYSEKRPKCIKLVESDVRYAFKLADRRVFQELLESNPGYDDVILTRNGLITDSTYCNLLFRKQGAWYTPEEPLLEGTRRASLLKSGLISTAKIHRNDLGQYDALMLVNAMLEFKAERALPMSIIAM